MRVGFVSDFDNTLFDTERLKEDLPILCHKDFPSVEPGMFSQVYRYYRASHAGSVSMHEILRDVASMARLPDDQKTQLLDGWLEAIPYRMYMFPGAYELIAGIGADSSYIITKSLDFGYQYRKIEKSGLSILMREPYLHIVDRKDGPVYSAWAREIKDHGIGHILYSSDVASELGWMSDAARELGMGFDGVHHKYGPHQFDDTEIIKDKLGERYHGAHTFSEFASVIVNLKTSIEGSYQQPEHFHSSRRETL